MERHTPFSIPLRPGDFGATQAASHHDLDTLSTKPQGRLNASLHGSPKSHTLLELSRDIFANQLCIKLRLLDFLDRDVDLPPVLFFKVRLQLIDFSSLSTDDDAGAGCMNDHP